MGEFLDHLQAGGGLIGTLVAAIVGLYWFVTKGLPVINSNLSGVAQENVARADMIAVLREERDAALAREDAAETRYADLLKDWAEMRGKFAAIESDLNRANQLIVELKEQLKGATATIDALRDDVVRLTLAVQEDRHA